MKHIRLLILIALTQHAIELKAQTFFIDSSNYYTFSNAVSLSGTYAFAYNIKETIAFDSVNQSGEHYSVLYQSKWRKDTYKLRTLDDKVYFTGRLETDTDTFEVNDLLIYDFTLLAGDTLTIRHDAGGLYVQLLIDSVNHKTFQDGISRKTLYHSILNDPGKEYKSGSPNLHYASKGLGSDYGLVPFKIKDRDTRRWQDLISICSQQQAPIYSDSFYSSIHQVKHFCDFNDLEKTLAELRANAIESTQSHQIRLYPNPASASLNVSGLESGTYKIYDSSGKLRQSGTTDSSISIEQLGSGFYYVLIEQSDRVYSGSFIKE